MNQSQPVELNREWIAHQFDMKLRDSLGRKSGIAELPHQYCGRGFLYGVITSPSTHKNVG